MDNLNIEFYVKDNDNVYANINTLRTMLSLHLDSVRYLAIGKGLVKIRKGLLNLGMHQIWIVVDESLFSTLYLKDKVRQHGEGNNRNLLIHVYISKTKGRKYKVDSIRGVNGPESSIAVTTTSDTLTSYEWRESQVNYKILYKK